MRKYKKQIIEEKNVKNERIQLIFDLAIFGMPKFVFTKHMNLFLRDLDESHLRVSSIQSSKYTLNHIKTAEQKLTQLNVDDDELSKPKKILHNLIDLIVYTIFKHEIHF